MATALVMPTGMGIVSTANATGTRRNIAFSCLAVGQVLGYALGLVLSGVFVESVGWRVGFYVIGVAMLGGFVVGLWALPADQLAERPSWKRIKNEVDWVGAGLASGSLAMFSYVLA